MADYREISQAYAQSGINAGFILNGGAAVACLSQFADLYPLELLDKFTVGMLAWAGGVFLAALVWAIAFVSARYVDKADDESNQQHIETSNKWMFAGLILVLMSYVCFVGGVISIALQFDAF
ncbi:hypothetical protein ACQKP1_10435 [Allorhizobium sp. NPDC080224]|uniref:Uncharacterized protein n=1 Tax=Rhizobium rosettiformans TaxID=1368430 RepID=A0ABX7F090_9HYPH|nr:hypothetical protein [Rhizobium rosettiformans]QRF53117.1 hypothetical protein D4A92_17575 [Rhizobium rosettiformans]